jgi:general secretion pathway protein B
MSYILDALRKSQQERDLGRVPTLTTDQLGTEQASSGAMRWVYSAVALAVAALVVAVIGVFLRTGDGVRDTAVASPAPARIDTRPQPSQEGSPGAEHPPGREGEPAPSEGYRSVTAGERSSGRAPEPGDTRLAAFPKAPPPPPVPTEPDWRRVPSLSDLPLAFQQTVPDMNVDVHVYLDAPDKRFVFINQRRYRQGERTTEGPVLEQIIPEGIVLRYEGRSFRLDI